MGRMPGSSPVILARPCRIPCGCGLRVMQEWKDILNRGTHRTSTRGRPPAVPGPTCHNTVHGQAPLGHAVDDHGREWDTLNDTSSRWIGVSQQSQWSKAPSSVESPADHNGAARRRPTIVRYLLGLSHSVKPKLARSNSGGSAFGQILRISVLSAPCPHAALPAARGTRVHSVSICAFGSLVSAHHNC